MKGTWQNWDAEWAITVSTGLNKYQVNTSTPTPSAEMATNTITDYEKVQRVRTSLSAGHLGLK